MVGKANIFNSDPAMAVITQAHGFALACCIYKYHLIYAAPQSAQSPQRPLRRTSIAAHGV